MFVKKLVEKASKKVRWLRPLLLPLSPSVSASQTLSFHFAFSFLCLFLADAACFFGVCR